MFPNKLERVDEDVLPAAKRQKLTMSENFQTALPDLDDEFWMYYTIEDLSC